MAALRVFSALLAHLTIDDLHPTETVFQIGVVPCRVAVLTGLSGVVFDDAWLGE